jgi:hypothetical protein
MVTGTIGDFQFAGRAETCGFYLWDGTDVRFPPQLAPSIKRIAIEGSRVHVMGWEHSGPQGRIHLHAERITNADTGESILI